MIGASEVYAGDFSWANCPTSASRLVPEGLNGYPEQCEAVVDAAAGPRTDELAEAAGGTRADVIAAVKAMFCAGTDAAVRDNSAAYEPFVPNWPEGAPFGAWVLNDLPFEGEVCFEAALLVAAERAVNRAGRIRVVWC